jgi:hypothetical protein
MSNGYLLAAQADLGGLGDIASGFGLDAVSTTELGSNETTAAAMQGAPNVGIVLSHAATRDVAFVALLHVLARTLRSAQLILAEPDARAAFAFLPETWPAMALADATTRATELLRRRSEVSGETPRAHPLPPVENEPPPIRERAIVIPSEPETEAPSVGEAAPEPETPAAGEDFESVPELENDVTVGAPYGGVPSDDAPSGDAPSDGALADDGDVRQDSLGAGGETDAPRRGSHTGRAARASRCNRTADARAAIG